jgi:hypothetical protein
MATKGERITEFLSRLSAAPSAASFAGARRLIDDTMNTVEDELSGVPFNPPTWMTDGRMYPVQDDRVYTVPGRADVKELQSFAHHSTFIRDNGAIRIQVRKSGFVMLDKPGPTAHPSEGRSP